MRLKVFFMLVILRTTLVFNSWDGVSAGLKHTPCQTLSASGRPILFHRPLFVADVADIRPIIRISLDSSRALHSCADRSSGVRRAPFRRHPTAEMPPRESGGMADAAASGAVARKGVKVRLLSLAQPGSMFRAA